MIIIEISKWRDSKIICKNNQDVLFNPKAYISEGEITLDTHSNEFGTLQIITIRDIHLQFTMIGPK